MKINDEVIKMYLREANVEEYRDLWVFNKIVEGEYLFEEPTYEDVEIVKAVYEDFLTALQNFVPLNEKIYKKIFPNYLEILSDSEIMLVVGCPAPYDAMVLNNNQKDIIIFDLIRFSDYVKEGYVIKDAFVQLITHELAHKCLHHVYPPNASTYVENLHYIAFDEGFAHILSFKDNIEEIDFTTEYYQEKYEASKSKFKEALAITDISLQKEYIKLANSGKYWDKFAAILGKLYLANNLENIEAIYQSGFKHFIKG